MRIPLFALISALAMTAAASAAAQSYPSDVQAQLQVAANDWLRAYTGYFGASVNGYNDNIRANNDGVRAYSQLVEANADYQLLRSQALLFRAEAEVQLAKARRLNLDNFFWYQQIHVFYAEKYQYLKDVHRIRKQAEYLRDDLALASNLRIGDLTKKNIEAFERSFRNLTMARPNDEVAQAFWSRIPALSAFNFRLQRNVSSTYIIPSFPGGNIWSLLNFVYRHDLSLEIGSEAHFFISSVYDKLSVSIFRQLTNLQQDADQLRTNFLSMIFQMGFSPSAAATSNH